MDGKLVTRLGSGLSLLTAVLLALASAGLANAQDARNDGTPAQPDKKSSYSLLEPKTGKLVSPMDVDASAIAHLPPGKVQGTVKTIAGAKFSDLKLSLCNARTGDTLMTTTTDADGHYVFNNVPEGRYVMYFQQQNVAAVVAAEVGAQAAPLNVALEDTVTTTPAPTWVPEAVANHPVLAAVGGGVVIGGIALGAAAAGGGGGGGSSSHAVVSPSSP